MTIQHRLLAALALLCLLGCCASAQGYYLSPPVPAEAFTRWLSQQRQPQVAAVTG